MGNWPRGVSCTNAIVKRQTTHTNLQPTFCIRIHIHIHILAFYIRICIGAHNHIRIRIHVHEG